jgi:tRNA 2-selenouridine synthase SelU
VSQASGVTQGLVAAKSRLAKQGLTIPRLELVSGHMASNAADNFRRALEGFPVRFYCCQGGIQNYIIAATVLRFINMNRFVGFYGYFDIPYSF